MEKSIKVIFQKQKPFHTEGTLHIRVIKDRKPQKRALKEKITETQWLRYFNPQNNRFRKDKRFNRYQEINRKIDILVKKIKENDNPTQLIPNDSKSFITYWEDIIETQTNHGSKIKHETVLRKLEKYLISINQTDLKFSEITPTFVRKLKFYLETAEDPKRLSLNSVNHYLKMMKSIIHSAEKEEVYSYSNNPFSSVSFRSSKTKKDCLSKSELLLWMKTDITTGELSKARDLWTFMVFANGMRVSDALTLRWNNINTTTGRISYKMFKTGKEISIPININLFHALKGILNLQTIESKLEFDRRFNIIDEFKYQDYLEEIYSVVYGRYPSIQRKLYKRGKGFKEFLNPNNSPYNLISFLDWTMFVDFKEKIDQEDLERKANEDMGRYENYFGYRIKSDDLILKEMIDLKRKFRKDIDRILIKELLKKIEENEFKNEFIFNFLDDELFSSIDDSNDFTRITEPQYKQIKHKTIVFNRALKKVQNICGITGVNVNSHTARHTFVNQLLSMENVNLFDISRALGHSNIKITDDYINSGFNVEKLDYINYQLTDAINRDY